MRIADGVGFFDVTNAACSTFVFVHVYACALLGLAGKLFPKRVKMTMVLFVFDNAMCTSEL